MSNKRLHNIWQGMKDRCYSRNLPANKAKYYRDKGIKVCDEWLYSFKYFEEWALENGYSDDLTIDRINSDGNYEPSNCQWITLAENTRKARMGCGIRHNEQSDDPIARMMSLTEREKKALKTISDALDVMTDWQKGYLVGYAECMADERDKARAEMPAADDASEKE